MRGPRVAVVHVSFFRQSTPRPQHSPRISHGGPASLGGNYSPAVHPALPREPLAAMAVGGLYLGMAGPKDPLDRHGEQDDSGAKDNGAKPSDP